jgi:hypothetical protein
MKVDLGGAVTGHEDSFCEESEDIRPAAKR